MTSDTMFMYFCTLSLTNVALIQTLVLVDSNLRVDNVKQYYLCVAIGSGVYTLTIASGFYIMIPTGLCHGLQGFTQVSVACTSGLIE